MYKNCCATCILVEMNDLVRRGWSSVDSTMVEAAAAALVAEMVATALVKVAATLETNGAGHEDERRRCWWRRGGGKGSKMKELFGSRTPVCFYRGGPFSASP